MEKLGKFFVGLLLALVCDLIIAYFVMLLWNALLPSLFAFPIINFIQSFGLMVLIDLMFKVKINIKA